MPVPNHGPTCQSTTKRTKCSRCNHKTFYFTCTCGSRVFFDTINPVCVEHFCQTMGSFLYDEQSSEELQRLGQYANDIGDQYRAREYFAKLVVMHPESDNAWIQLGNATPHLSEKRFCFEQASKINSDKFLKQLLENLQLVDSNMPMILLSFPRKKWNRFILLDEVIIKQRNNLNFKCNICGKTFDSNYSAEAHVRKSHLQLLREKISQGIEISKQQQRRLIKNVKEFISFRCIKCGAFIKQSSLRQHKDDCTQSRS